MIPARSGRFSSAPTAAAEIPIATIKTRTVPKCESIITSPNGGNDAKIDCTASVGESHHDGRTGRGGAAVFAAGIHGLRRAGRAHRADGRRGGQSAEVDRPPAVSGSGGGGKFHSGAQFNGDGDSPGDAAGGVEGADCRGSLFHRAGDA